MELEGLIETDGKNQRIIYVQMLGNGAGCMCLLHECADMHTDLTVQVTEQVNFIDSFYKHYRNKDHIQ